MRVLHVLHTSLPHVCGYSLRSDQIIRWQRAAGIDVAVVSSAQQPDESNANATIEGVQYFRSLKPKAAPSPLRELRLMSALSVTLTRACETFAPDIVHAHSPVLVGLPALRLARRRNLPMVYEVRDLWENASVDRGKFATGSMAYRVARWLETYVLQRADAVVTIGDTLRAELAGRTSRPIVVTPNGVDIEAFVPETPTKDWSQRWNSGGHRLMAYVGSFQPYEGLELLIRAMPAIRASVSDAALLIAGDGPERAALEHLATATGVSSYVRFAGRVPHQQVREIYSVADLLVYPRIDSLTTRLTTPLKPLEALAAGKAVLASDLPALRELIVGDKTGWLFRAGSAEELAVKATTLLTSDELRRSLGAAGRQAVLQGRTWQASVARYLPVYEQLTRPRAR